MNGSAHSALTVMEIRLKRGPAGLGFNIVGGVDHQFLLNDSSIYVAKIKANGAAALDGRLQEGDKILAINGSTLQNLSHNEAVELFRSAGEDVVLSILQRPAHSTNGPVNSRPDRESSWSLSSLVVPVVVLAVGVTAFVICKRATIFTRHHAF